MYIIILSRNALLFFIFYIIAFLKKQENEFIALILYIHNYNIFFNVNKYIYVYNRILFAFYSLLEKKEKERERKNKFFHLNNAC